MSRGTPGQLSVLFVSHDAWRTGAPTVLLHFLGWLRRETNVRFSVLLRDGVGDLRPAFERLADVFVWTEIDTVSGGTLAARRQFEDYLRLEQPALTYSNTVTNGPILEALAPTRRPAITHVHELEYWIRFRTPPSNLRQHRQHTARFVAASHAVKAAVVSCLDVPDDRVDVVHDFIDHKAHVRRETRAQLRQRLGLADQAFVVCGSGTTDWRKAPDLFVQLAATVRRLAPGRDVHFVWVGGEREGPSWAALQHDAVRAGVGERVQFVGVQTNPVDYFAAADVFALVSREDPFPLVSLESASVATPIVCFSGAGGAPEFVEQDAGIVVPYLDVYAMAEAVLNLERDPARRVNLGRCGAARVKDRHDVTVAGPQLLQVMKLTIDRQYAPA